MAYSGDFVHDEIEGCGRYVYANGDMYEGRFVAGKRHGYGMYHYKVGTRVRLGGMGRGSGGTFGHLGTRFAIGLICYMPVFLQCCSPFKYILSFT
jgi:hypothetical protein